MQSFCVFKHTHYQKKSLKICVWITFYVYRAGMLQSKGWSRIMNKNKYWLVKDRSYVAYCLH